MTKSVLTQPQALFLDKASLYPDDLDFSSLENVAQWKWLDNAVVSDAETQTCLKQAEILVSNKVMLDRAVIASCKKLKLICVAATGVNNVDLVAAQEYGIKVCNVRAYATASVTQHVFSLILSLNRKLSSYKQSAINGRWSQSEFFCYFGEPISDLENKVLGIIGYGELGKAVEKVALSFGMEVLIAESHHAKSNADDANVTKANKRVDIKTLLACSDVVSLHCPLTKNNQHMIAANEFSIMKKSAVIINTARGGLIDESALLSVLENNEIAGAGLDVLEQEPPEKGNALINYAQNNKRAENLIITPHIAWASQQARQNLVNQIAENIRAYQIGKARNLVV
jgi:glycerate dehydrogenase